MIKFHFSLTRGIAIFAARFRVITDTDKPNAGVAQLVRASDS